MNAHTSEASLFHCRPGVSVGTRAPPVRRQGARVLTREVCANFASQTYPRHSSRSTSSIHPFIFAYLELRKGGERVHTDCRCRGSCRRRLSGICHSYFPKADSAWWVTSHDCPDPETATDPSGRPPTGAEGRESGTAPRPVETAQEIPAHAPAWTLAAAVHKAPSCVRRPCVD